MFLLQCRPYPRPNLHLIFIFIFIFIFFLIIFFSYFLFSLFTKGSSGGATLSFALRSKGEGCQPRYLIIQEIASHFSTPPSRPPRTLRADPKHCNVPYFCAFGIEKVLLATY